MENIDNLLNNQRIETVNNLENVSEVIDFLYFKTNKLEEYSTYELELIIEYNKYSKTESLFMIDNFTKSDIMKRIEAWRFSKLNLSFNEKLRVNKKSSFDENTKDEYLINKNFDASETNFNEEFESLPLVKSKTFVLKKENKISIDHIEKSTIKDQTVKYTYKINPKTTLLKENSFDFLKKSVNIIDIKDLMRNIDHHKLINEAIQKVKDKDTKKLNNFFDKFDQERILKIKNVCSNAIEVNDLKFINDTEEFSDLLKTDFKPEKNYEIFSDYFIDKLGPSLKSFITDFLGINGILSLSLVNKKLNTFISTKYNKENISKLYCESIFKNSIYNNDYKYLRENYSNFYSMLKNRPRIKYGGIYYSTVRITKKIDLVGLTSTQNLQTVFYFRYLRFSPDGKVFTVTSPEKSTKKLNKEIMTGSAVIKEGTFTVEYNTLLIKMNYNRDYNLLYRYEIKQLEIDLIKYNGLELINCELISLDGEETLEFKTNEYFPKIFKYRSLKVLEEDIYISKSIVVK